MKDLKERNFPQISRSSSDESNAAPTKNMAKTCAEMKFHRIWGRLEAINLIWLFMVTRRPSRRYRNPLAAHFCRLRAHWSIKVTRAYH